MTFLPSTLEEMRKLGWTAPDIILVSGDAYIDSPYNGVAIVGRVLTAAGFKVAVIAQPDVRSHADITRLGAPRLFWGVSAGCVDSMVANYTANHKKRRQDDFTPGGQNNARPNRAVIAYCNLIRAAFRPCQPLVIGGVEASLRRVAHYDYWSDQIRRPLLFDAKADILVYGMAEKTIVALARALRDGQTWHTLRGLCYIATPASLPPDALPLPAYATVADKSPTGRRAFLDMYRLFAQNQEAHYAQTLTQQVDTRYLVHTPPALPLTSAELDAIYDLPFQLEAHPIHRPHGKIRALDTIRFAITTHRGCYGECNFCAIAVHQGRQVISRSQESIVKEARRLTQHPQFKGIIQDVGGPTANMYGFECQYKLQHGACRDKRCLFPDTCPQLKPTHAPLLKVLQQLRALPRVRKVFVASGIRTDLIAADHHGHHYVESLVRHHVSGQLKLAPEHTAPVVLELMGKPDHRALLAFKQLFEEYNRQYNKRQFLTYYFIAAHPGCRMEDMHALKRFVSQHLHLIPEQVQIFTPTPSTWSTAMYYSGLNPFNGQAIEVVRDLGARQRQKDLLTGVAQKTFPRFQRSKGR